MLIGLFKKYKGIILYAIFGVLTTVINVATYYVLYDLLHITNVVSTIVAWFLAVAFAFVVNKQWVFESPSWSKKVFWQEIRDFFACRLLTGLFDVGVMYVAVDLMCWNSAVWKLVSNLLVIILNYIASKLIIFKKT